MANAQHRLHPTTVMMLLFVPCTIEGGYPMTWQIVAAADDDEIIVINRSNTDSSTISNSNIQRETELGARYNSRGKLSRHVIRRIWK
jgi:hypothetical protein